MKERGAALLLRCCFAFVWIANGLSCKILDLVPRHRMIVARVLPFADALLLTKLIGFGELLIAVWILTNYRPRLCAFIQILLIAVMNCIERLLAVDLLLFGKWNILFAFLFMVFLWLAYFGLPFKQQNKS